MLSDIDIESLELLEGLATSGPWCDRRIGREGNGISASQHEQICNGEGIAVFMLEHDGGHDGSANVLLMMAARNALPSLIAEIRNLKEKIIQLQSDKQDLSDGLVMEKNARIVSEAALELAKSSCVILREELKKETLSRNDVQNKMMFIAKQIESIL
ncbi:MAG TPA: hypothetical protein VIE65_08680 [Methylobacter sp.]|jgi:hypothetical protein